MQGVIVSYNKTTRHMSQCHDDQSLNRQVELVWYGVCSNAIRITVCTVKKVKHLQEIILVSRGKQHVVTRLQTYMHRKTRTTRGAGEIKTVSHMVYKVYTVKATPSLYICYDFFLRQQVVIYKQQYPIVTFLSSILNT